MYQSIENIIYLGTHGQFKKPYDDSRPLKLSQSVQLGLLVTPSLELKLYMIPEITPSN